MVSFETFQSHIDEIQQRIRTACENSGRKPESIEILPVTKTHPIQAVQYAREAGFRAVGENRVQEAMEKRESPDSPEGLEWELIGHLQSNKARDAVETFDRIQSVDSLKLLNRLNRFAEELEKPLRILLQINAGEDPQKFGVSCEEAQPFTESALNCDFLRVEGFMTIAPLDENPQIARECFLRMRELRDSLQESFASPFPVLSMGMTGDLEAAIEAGSTQIRVGTALFGTRE